MGIEYDSGSSEGGKMGWTTTDGAVGNGRSRLWTGPVNARSLRLRYPARPLFFGDSSALALAGIFTIQRLPADSEEQHQHNGNQTGINQRCLRHVSTLLRPVPGLVVRSRRFPCLTPWATFCRPYS